MIANQEYKYRYQGIDYDLSDFRYLAIWYSIDNLQYNAVELIIPTWIVVNIHNPLRYYMSHTFEGYRIDCCLLISKDKLNIVNVYNTLPTNWDARDGHIFAFAYN